MGKEDAPLTPPIATHQSWLVSPAPGACPLSELMVACDVPTWDTQLSPPQSCFPCFILTLSPFTEGEHLLLHRPRSENCCTGTGTLRHQCSNTCCVCQSCAHHPVAPGAACLLLWSCTSEASGHTLLCGQFTLGSLASVKIRSSLSIYNIQ